MNKDSKKNPAPIAPTSASGVPATAKARVAKPESGTAVKRGNTASGGATGATARRKNKLASGGASYGIRVKIPAYKATEAGTVQGNGRLFSPAVKRTAPNFWDGTKVNP